MKYRDIERNQAERKRSKTYIKDLFFRVEEQMNVRQARAKYNNICTLEKLLKKK